MGAANVAAVIVTYHPDAEALAEGLRAVRPQVGALLVVDNGSPADTVARLRVLAQAHDCRLMEQGDNLGLGTAHNAGIDFARERGCSHVLLLDQDSVAEGSMVERLLAAEARLRAAGHRVAAVGPRYRDRNTGATSSFVRFGTVTFTRVECAGGDPLEAVRTDFLISSGSLVALDTIAGVGAMDEGLFVDHVDTEWFLRARSLGYDAFGVCGAFMSHDLGRGSVRFWLGRWRNVARHSPLRHYYIFRNSVLLYRRRYAPARWIWNDVVRLVLMFVIFGIATAPRRAHAGAMLRGLRDGLAGRAGRADRLRPV